MFRALSDFYKSMDVSPVISLGHVDNFQYKGRRLSKYRYGFDCSFFLFFLWLSKHKIDTWNLR
jgi:hypothetical protein